MQEATYTMTSAMTSTYKTMQSSTVSKSASMKSKPSTNTTQPIADTSISRPTGNSSENANTNKSLKTSATGYKHKTQDTMAETGLKIQKLMMITQHQKNTKWDG